MFDSDVNSRGICVYVIKHVLIAKWKHKLTADHQESAAYIFIGSFRNQDERWLDNKPCFVVVDASCIQS